MVPLGIREAAISLKYDKCAKMNVSDITLT